MNESNWKTWPISLWATQQWSERPNERQMNQVLSRMKREGAGMVCPSSSAPGNLKAQTHPCTPWSQGLRCWWMIIGKPSGPSHSGASLQKKSVLGLPVSSWLQTSCHCRRHGFWVPDPGSLHASGQPSPSPQLLSLGLGAWESQRRSLRPWSPCSTTRKLLQWEGRASPLESRAPAHRN